MWCPCMHRCPFKLIMLLSTYSAIFLEHWENHFPISFLTLEDLTVKSVIYALQIKNLNT